MSLVVEQTLPYSPQELKLDDATRWSRLFSLMRPSVKNVETSNGQIVVIDTALSNSKDVLIAAVGGKSNHSSRILSESHIAAFTVEKVDSPVISADEFAMILKENGYPIQNGLVVVRSGMKPQVVNTGSQVLEVCVQGGVGLHHVISLLLAAKPEVKSSFEKLKEVLECFVKSSTKTVSSFYEKKTGDVPSLVRGFQYVKFGSAKKAVGEDLSHLLGLSSSKAGDDIVYSVHYTDMNGLSQLENNILAHEISQYFANKNLPLHLTHSTITIQSDKTLSRGWITSLALIPKAYLSPLSKPTAPLSESKSSSTSKTTIHLTTKIRLPSPSTLQIIITTGCNKIIAAEPIITHYDTLVGDGDCGTTLASGASFVLSFLSSQPPDSLSSQNLPNTISTLVEELEINMGGTSGALYCIFLSSLAIQLLSETHRTFPEVLKGALGELMKFTRARKGDRTMMDCLIPFVDELGTGGVKKALEEARKGVEGTRTMEANLGRSSYLDESATRGVPDPGAYGLLMLFEGMVEGLERGA